jgi:hypothetical protein
MTVDELVRDILGSFGLKTTAPLVARWIDNRYREVVSVVKFPHLRNIGELTLEAAYSTGTVSATKGSTAVAGTSTAWDVYPGVATHTNYYIRFTNIWYKVASVGAAGTLVLASALVEDSITDGTYELVRRFYSLTSSARWIGSFVLTRLRFPLDVISPEQLDLDAPGRTFAGSYPGCVAQSGVDSSGAIQVEVYPYPENAELVHYIYWSLPTALTIFSTIPAQIEQVALKEGVLIDVYRYQKMEQLRLGNIEAAALLRNDEQAQMTRWRDIRKELIRTGKGVDDVSFILAKYGVMGGGSGNDIRSGREEVYSKWSF